MQVIMATGKDMRHMGILSLRTLMLMVMEPELMLAIQIISSNQWHSSHNNRSDFLTCWSRLRITNWNAISLYSSQFLDASSFNLSNAVSHVTTLKIWLDLMELYSFHLADFYQPSFEYWCIWYEKTLEICRTLCLDILLFVNIVLFCLEGQFSSEMTIIGHRCRNLE